MVFQGGGLIKAWIMAVNLENGRVLWRRFYQTSSAEMNSINAMSVSPDGSYIAAVGSQNRDSNVQWFFTVRAADGGH